MNIAIEIRHPVHRHGKDIAAAIPARVTDHQAAGAHVEIVSRFPGRLRTQIIALVRKETESRTQHDFAGLKYAEAGGIYEGGGYLSSQGAHRSPDGLLPGRSAGNCPG